MTKRLIASLGLAALIYYGSGCNINLNNLESRVAALQPSPTATITPTVTYAPILTPTKNPTSTPTYTTTPTPTPTSTPTLTPTATLTPKPTNAATPTFTPTSTATINVNDDNWIEIDLSEQKLYFRNKENKIVYEALISSGVAKTPTRKGEFRIYVKYRFATMSGGQGSDYYYLPNVPFVMYYDGDYGVHGTYWHNNFGTPMSRGCVNLSIEDAKWVYEYSKVGTRVVIHE